MYGLYDFFCQSCVYIHTTCYTQLQSCIAEQILIQNYSYSSDVLVDLHIIDVHIFLCCMKVFLFDATLK